MRKICCLFEPFLFVFLALLAYLIESKGPDALVELYSADSSPLFNISSHNFLQIRFEFALDSLCRLASLCRFRFAFSLQRLLLIFCHSEKKAKIFAIANSLFEKAKANQSERTNNFRVRSEANSLRFSLQRISLSEFICLSKTVSRAKAFKSSPTKQFRRSELF